MVVINGRSTFRDDPRPRKGNLVDTTNPTPVRQPSGRLSIQDNVVIGANPGGFMTREEATAPLRASAAAGGRIEGIQPDRQRAGDSVSRQFGSGSQQRRDLTLAGQPQPVIRTPEGTSARQTATQSVTRSAEASIADARNKAFADFVARSGDITSTRPTNRFARPQSEVEKLQFQVAFGDTGSAAQARRQLQDLQTAAFQESDEFKQFQQEESDIKSRSQQDITRQTRQIATSGGVGTGTLESQNKQLAEFVKQAAGLGDDFRVVRQSDGSYSISGADIQLDPFERARERSEVLEERSLQDINRTYKPQEQAIQNRFTFRTGPRAGQLTEQGKRQMQKLLTAKKRQTDRVVEDREFEREGLIIEEANRQIDLEKKLAKETDPAKLIAEERAQDLVNRINEKLATGEASDVAEAQILVERELSLIGKGPSSEAAFKTFSAQIDTGKVSPQDAFDYALSLPGINGNVKDATDVLKAKGFSDSFIDQEVERYQIDTLKIPASYVGETNEFQKNQLAFSEALEGKSDPTGLSIFSSIESLAKNDTENGLIKKSLIRQALNSDFVKNNPFLFTALEQKLDEVESADVEIREFGGELLAIDPVTKNTTVIRGAPSGIGAEEFDNTYKVRKDFQARSKDFIASRDQFETLEAARNRARTDETGASDVAMVFAFMKTLDPTSVVREGEFAQAAKSAGLSTQIINSFQKVDKGKFLSEQQRDSLVQVAKDVFDKKVKNQKDFYNRERRFAKQTGLNPDLAVPDLIRGEKAEDIIQGDVAPEADFGTLGFDSFSNVNFSSPARVQQTRPIRNLNPINIKRGGVADQFAAKNPDGTPKVDDQGHLIFPNPQAGVEGGKADLRAKVEGRSRFLPDNPTIAQLGKIFAEDPNWANGVSTILGVDINTPTKNVDFDELFKAVARQEGGSKLINNA